MDTVFVNHVLKICSIKHNRNIIFAVHYSELCTVYTVPRAGI